MSHLRTTEQEHRFFQSRYKITRSFSLLETLFLNSSDTLHRRIIIVVRYHANASTHFKIQRDARAPHRVGSIVAQSDCLAVPLTNEPAQAVIIEDHHVKLRKSLRL
jgi:hypothetical protein